MYLFCLPPMEVRARPWLKAVDFFAAGWRLRCFPRWYGRLLRGSMRAAYAWLSFTSWRVVRGLRLLVFALFFRR